MEYSEIFRPVNITWQYLRNGNVPSTDINSPAAYLAGTNGCHISA